MCHSWKKYIYIFLPAAAFATNEMESDMDKDRGGRFLKNCFLDYISKKQKPVFFFFSARLWLSFSCTAIRGTDDMTYFTASWEGTKEGVTVLDRVCWWEPFGFFEQL